MKCTTRNFLRVVYDRKCAAIVSLSDIMEDGSVSSVYAMSDRHASVFHMQHH